MLKSMKHVGLYLAAGNFLRKIPVVAMHLLKKHQMQCFFKHVQLHALYHICISEVTFTK